MYTIYKSVMLLYVTRSLTQAIVNKFDPLVRYFETMLSAHSFGLLQKTAGSESGNTKQNWIRYQTEQ